MTDFDPDRPPTPAQVRAAVRTKPDERSLKQVARDVGITPRALQYARAEKGAKTSRLGLPAWRMLLLVLGIHPQKVIEDRD